MHVMHMYTGRKCINNAVHCVVDIGEDIEDIRGIWESNRELSAYIRRVRCEERSSILYIAAVVLRRCCEVDAV